MPSSQMLLSSRARPNAALASMTGPASLTREARLSSEGRLREANGRAGEEATAIPGSGQREIQNEGE